jgi:excisionase family DNA binding protein
MLADSDSFSLSHTPNPAKPPSTALPPQVVAGQRRYLSTEEACTYLGCHKRTIDRLVKTKRLKANRLGRTRKFLPEDLDAALEPVNPQPKGPKDSLNSHIDKQTKR